MEAYAPAPPIVRHTAPENTAETGSVSLGRYTARRFRDKLRNFLVSFRIERRYENLRVTHPVSWVTDAVEAIQIGEHVSIGPFSEIVVLSASEKSEVQSGLVIGSYTALGSHCNIRAAGGRIEIGSNCLIGQNVALIGSNHQVAKGILYWKAPWEWNKTGVKIGENCWIGAGVTVLPGCEIGDNSVIAAGGVVTRSVPENEIWAGVPARKLRDI